MTLLEVRDLTAGYGPAEVLHGVSLRVEEAEIVLSSVPMAPARRPPCAPSPGSSAGRARSISMAPPSLAFPDKVVAAGVSLVPQGRGTFAKLSVDDNLHVGAANGATPGH